MKKLAILVLSLSLCIPGMSKEGPGSWVETTGQGKVECQKVVLRGDILRVILANGDRTHMESAGVISFSCRGELYLKRSFYVKGQLQDPVFMKQIDSKDGLDLLRYAGKHGKHEFVYEGDSLVNVICEANREAFYALFGIQRKF
jgi:hypothetical protein